MEPETPTIELVLRNGEAVARPPDEAPAPDPNVVRRLLRDKARLYEATDPELARLLRVLLTEIVVTTTDPVQQMAGIKILSEIPGVGMKAARSGPAPLGARALSPDTQRLLESLPE